MTDDQIRQAVGALIRAQLDHLNLSTSEGAARCLDEQGQAYSDSTLRSYIAGRRSLTVPRLYHIARGLEVSPRALLPGGDGHEGRPFTDVTLRVRLGEGVDLDALEHAMVAAAETHAHGGRVVVASMPMPDAAPGDDPAGWWPKAAS